jgi:DNA repair exonuclease SbcCD ATPase subunit
LTVPPAETIEEAFRDTSALPTSLLMGWLLASSLYKRDIDKERMKSKREKEKVEEDVALKIQELQDENQELQEEIQYSEKQVEEDVAQLEQQIQELQEKNQYLEKQSRGTRGTQQRWNMRVQDIVQEDNLKTVPEAVVYRQNPVYPLFDKKLRKMEMPENNCSLDTFAATLASLNTEKKIKDYVNTFLIEFSMNCQTLDYGSGVKEIMRLQKARLMQIRP